MARKIIPREDPRWTLDDPRYVANYLIDEIEFLAFEMKALLLRLEGLEANIVKLREMRQNTLVNVLLDFIQAWDSNLFTGKDIFKAVGINSQRTKNKVFSYLSMFVRQGRVYRGEGRGTYVKTPPMPTHGNR